MTSSALRIKNGLKKKISSESKDNLRLLIKKFDWVTLPLLSFNLPILALLCGTDKLTHGYIEHYVMHLKRIRKKKLNVLEIGVKDGYSLRMWKHYFPRSFIYGIDIEDKHHLESKRVQIFQGSQNDPVFLNELAQKLGGFDIIIDDGSHKSEHIITSFNALFPFLRNGGTYIIEDLQTSYWSNFGGEWRTLNGSKSSMSMLKSLVDGLNYHWIPGREAKKTDQSIVSIHFYPKIAFIFKNKNEGHINASERKNIEFSLSSDK